jgi:hypothetical protein
MVLVFGVNVLFVSFPIDTLGDDIERSRRDVNEHSANPPELSHRRFQNYTIPRLQCMKSNNLMRTSEMPYFYYAFRHLNYLPFRVFQRKQREGGV